MDLENIAMGHFDAWTKCLVGNVNEANSFLFKINQDNILSQNSSLRQEVPTEQTCSGSCFHQHSFQTADREWVVGQIFPTILQGLPAELS